MADMNKKKTKLEVALGLLLTVGLNNFAFASTTTSDTEHYLVIATGQSSEPDHFIMSNVEIGAVQEFLSDGDPVNGSGNDNQRLGRYTGINQGYDGGTSLIGQVTISDATRDVVEGIDYSGNAALIGSQAKLASENSDVNANSGILCASSGCDQDDTSFFSDVDDDGIDDAIPQAYAVGNGATHNVDFSAANGLINDLAQQRDWIVDLETDVTWDMGDIAKFDDGGNIITTSIDDLIDDNGANKNDGYYVIDLDLDADASGYFKLNNVNWIIESLNGLTAIFRMVDGQYFSFANSSIMLSDGTGNDQAALDGELGAIFYQDAYVETNELFNVSNVVLGGIGLWDFTDFNPAGGGGDKGGTLMHRESNELVGSVWTDHGGTDTKISLSVTQGCGQFISNTVNIQNGRWARCARALPSETVDVPEPSTLLLLSLGLFGLRLRNKAV